ncbi:MAG: hypothetical protein AB8B58_10770 [Roseobacter sp.]
MTFAIMESSSKFRAISHDVLQQNGVTVTCGTNFQSYKRMVHKERGHQMMALPFEPDVLQQDGCKAFWMIARDSAGALIHTQAARLVEIGNRSFPDFMVKGFRAFPPPLPDLDPDRSRYRPSPGAKHISGRVVYHGDVWMGDTERQFRGSGLSTVLARMALHEIMQTYLPDYIFGLMARTVACKGFAERMGYMHNEPGAVTWYRQGQDAPLEGYLSYLSREDTEYVLSMPLPFVAPERARAA